MEAESVYYGVVDEMGLFADFFSLLFLTVGNGKEFYLGGFRPIGRLADGVPRWALSKNFASVQGAKRRGGERAFLLFSREEEGDAATFLLRVRFLIV